MKYSNYHTHTKFCDGKDSPEQMVEKAIELGMNEIGFSGHSELSQNLEAYRKEILRLKEKYADKIKVRLGIEYDYFSDIDTSEYEYVIGGVHYLEKGGTLHSLDHSEESFLMLVNKYYGGDFYALCEDYFETLSKIYEKTGCDLVAHFDLVTKYNEADRLFDTSHPRYIKAAQAALKAVMKYPVIFEINTGAIARGYRKTPYPAPNLVEIIRASGAPTILSADCHDKDFLTESFDKYKAYATLDKLPKRIKP